jgi:hypothetical protein
MARRSACWEASSGLWVGSWRRLKIALSGAWTRSNSFFGSGSLSEASIARCQDRKWVVKGEEDCFVIHRALQGMILILVLTV